VLMLARASISAPTVSMPLIVFPIELNAVASGSSMTLMSKYFSISVSSAGGPTRTTGCARKRWVYLFVSDGSE
jgi:hypothetical protein